MAPEPNLRAATLHGVRWTTFGRIGVESLAFGSSLLIARLVPPAEYGSAVIALTVYALALSVSTQGFGVPIVQRATIGKAHVKVAVALSSAFGATLAILTALFGFTLGDSLFGDRTGSLIVLASPLFLFAALGAVPQALLQRRLAFRKLAKAEVFGALPGTGTALSAALAGLDGEAVVLGVLVTALVSSLVLIRMAPSGAPQWDRAAASDILGFGLPAAVGSLFYNGTRNVDYVIVGAQLSTALAGQYARAFQLAVDYQAKISGILLRIALPVYARAGDIQRIRAVRARIVRTHATGLFPLLALLAATAPVAVPFLYGDAWEEAIVPTQILAVAGMVVVLGTGTGPLIIALGRPRVLLAWNLVSFAILASALLAVAEQGLLAVCWTVVAVKVLTLVGLQELVVRRLIGWGTVQMLRKDAGPALISSVASFAAARAIIVWGERMPDAAVLAAAAIAGAAAYVVVLSTVFPSTAADLRVLVAALARRDMHLKHDEPGPEAAADEAGGVPDAPVPDAAEAAAGSGRFPREP